MTTARDHREKYRLSDRQSQTFTTHVSFIRRFIKRAGRRLWRPVGGCSCEISRPGQTRGAPLWHSFVNLEQENAAETGHTHFSTSHTHTCLIIGLNVAEEKPGDYSQRRRRHITAFNFHICSPKHKRATRRNCSPPQVCVFDSPHEKKLTSAFFLSLVARELTLVPRACSFICHV